MSTRKARFKFRGVEALSVLGSRCVQIDRVAIGKWVSGVVVVVLALTLGSATTALAAGGERTTEPLSVRPTTTHIPPSSNGFYYTVRRGDTLSRIAWRFGTTVAAIVQANGIVNPNQIFYGQVFWIPSSGGNWAGSSVYIVRRGDTLYAIARRFGTTYQALATLNGLHYPYTIYAGQRLVVSGSGAPGPTNPPSGRVYVVRPGDTLCSIALRYGVTPWAIAQANGLWNLNLVYVGQRLTIP